MQVRPRRSPLIHLSPTSTQEQREVGTIANVRGTITALTIFLVLGAVTPGFALDNCKAKINGGDGTIEVSASDVQGTLQWGRLASFDFPVFALGNNTADITLSPGLPVAEMVVAPSSPECSVAACIAMSL